MTTATMISVKKCTQEIVSSTKSSIKGKVSYQVSCGAFWNLDQFLERFFKEFFFTSFVSLHSCNWTRVV